MADALESLVKVFHCEGDFASKLVSLVDRRPGEVLARIEGWTPATQRTYTSVQAGEDLDIDLNSDLVYCNHSCDPTVVFDMSKFEVRVADDNHLRKGDEITFFYPSTEENMDQPFACRCGSERCLGNVRGAKYLDDAVLKSYWLNAHIESLSKKRSMQGQAGSAQGV